MYLSLYCKGSKRLFKVCVWDGAGDRTELKYFDPPTLMAVNVVSFSFSRCSTGSPGPTLLGDGFLYCILSATSLVPKLHQGSRGPLRPDVVFTYHNSSISVSNSTATGTRTVLTSVLTELYNSSTPTRSPTRSLKSHV